MSTLKTRLVSTIILASLAALPAYSAPSASPLPAIGDLPASNAGVVADFRKQADAAYRAKEEAFRAGKADPIVEQFYSRDAISFTSQSPEPSIGREAFRKEYSELVKIATVKIEPVSAHVGTDAAWEWANFQVSPKPGAKDKPFTFMILFLWAKKGGRWICGGDAAAYGELPASIGPVK